MKKSIGWWVAPLVALGACNALVGVEDVSLRHDASGDGGSETGGTDGIVAGMPGAAGSGVTEGGAGGSGGGAGEPSGAGAGAAGEGGVGGLSGDGGAGGEGGDKEEPHPCPLPGEEVPVRGPLTLVQFALHDAPRGRVNVSADGKHAYVTSWGFKTQHFTRDGATGWLTPKSFAGVYNGEFSVLSPTSARLFVGGSNATQYYSIPIAADGTIADTTTPLPPSYKPPLDAVAVGDTIFVPSGSSIRAIENDVYDATNRVPGTYDGVRGLQRSREYLYWTEYANQVQFPNGATAVGRARFQCDGSLGPRETFATGFAPWDVAACDETGMVYVLHASKSLPGEPGWVDVVDLSTCAADFSSCKPLKKLTSADVPGLVSPSGIRLSTDCSTMFLSTANEQGTGAFFVLSLKNPASPALLQTFESGLAYGGVTISGGIWAWHMTFADGYLYVPMEFGEGVAVFKGQ